METQYTKKYLEIRDCVREIITYTKGINVDIEKCAQIFLLHLQDINTQYYTFNNKIVNNKELVIIQRWINRITGNKNIRRITRKVILEESLVFNEMVESIYVSMKVDAIVANKGV